MVKLDTLTMPSAKLDGINPFPDIKNVSYIRAGYAVGESLDEEERRYVGKGMIPTLLPYKLQDAYDRDRTPTDHRVAVLENSKLRAVFLPDLGGRLWSLTDKATGRELLYTNTVYQPANFALRNAWFSGGVEFNIGIKGHSPLTASPLFCEFAESGDALRLFGFERIRGVSYSITAYLPEDSDILFIRTRVTNSTDNEMHMYWWSNIAFPETDETRTIVPTDDAIGCLYRENHYSLDKTSIPVTNIEPVGIDVSYSARLPFSADYFYKIPPEEEKWIAAADGDGKGLLQYSDAFLKGRKLFLWGGGVGGRHWNEFLAEEGQAYIEIQAGLANTQLEHIPMPPHTEWEWTEGYTALNCERDDIHGDYFHAVDVVRGELHKKAVQPSELTSIEFPTKFKRVTEGSGWGMLEDRIRKICGKAPLNPTVDFTLDSPDAETSQWHKLLDEGILPCPDENAEPASYVVGEFWENVLTESLSRDGGEHWYAYLQLGVVKYAAAKCREAEAMWKKSVELKPTLWAYRNLAALASNEFEDKAAALDYMERASHYADAFSKRYFCAEYAGLLTSTGNDAKWLEIYASLNDKLKSVGRLQFFYAAALLHVGRIDDAAAVIDGDFVMCDVKEGELSLSKLWFDIYEAKHGKSAPLDAIPYELDFRMH